MENVITYPFNVNFLENLAEHFYQEYFLKRKNFQKIAIVFGGKRPALFLKQALAKKIKYPFFSPAFFSIEEFIDFCLSKKEKFQKLLELEAGYLIYKIVKDEFPLIVGKNDFPDFLSWSREILGFIEQLDLEDKNKKALLNIEESAKIGYGVPSSVSELLKNISFIREMFHKIQEKKKQYTRGYRYLKASQIVEELNLEEFEIIYFCNFYFLHATEAKIIKNFFKKKKAFLVFQGDQKDWPALENLANDFSIRIEANNIVLKKPEYNFFTCNTLHEETSVLREIIKKIPEEERNSTLVVLPDAESLVPVLSEISEEVRDFNVSLGYPLKRNTLIFLLKNIFKAQLTKHKDKYYTRDYLRILKHPLVKNYFPDGSKSNSDSLNEELISKSRILVHKIEEIILGLVEAKGVEAFSGVLFLSLEKLEKFSFLFQLAGKFLRSSGKSEGISGLKEILKKIHQLFFYSWEQINSFEKLAKVLENLIKEFLASGAFVNSPLNLMIALKLIELVDEFKKISFSKEIFTEEGIFKIFEQILEKEFISFSGSPLKGLQILGFLESRSLNFKNVIFLDMNESVLPRLKTIEPLIPREVMVNLGLVSVEKEEEIQRYHFYRLIRGAEKVFLIYQENNEKEKSRFVEELIWQEQKEKTSLSSVQVFKAEIPMVIFSEIESVLKTSQITSFLKNDFVYSASSLDVYLHCPFRFYFQYVLGLEEKKKFTEEVESSKIGIFIHTLLKESFEKFKIFGKKPLIDEVFEKEFFELFEKNFIQTFEKTMKADSFLLKEVMLTRLKNFLKNERERAVSKIVYLEETFEKKLRLPAGYFNFKVVIDRLDYLESKNYLIIDYKTGGISNHKPLKFEKINFEDRQKLKKTLKSFQLPLYFYFLKDKFKNLDAALYSLRDASMEYLFKDETESEKYQIIDKKLIPALDFIISEIIDESKEFSADFEDANYCKNCPYSNFCR